jgi:hypothetical protein
MIEEGICGGGGGGRDDYSDNQKVGFFLLICCSMLCVMHKNKYNNSFLHPHTAYGIKIKSTSFHFRKIIGENN